VEHFSDNENADDELPSFGRYQTLRLLGEGAMASVFLAKDPRLSRRVAIKVIKPHLLESEAALQRFRAEASILANLRHANILQVHDYDVEEDMHFLVMEFVEGPGFQSLLNEMRGRPLPPPVAAFFLNQAALGLAAAHKQGLVHRDIKPDNMLLTLDGALKIADFGIAHMADLNLTQAGDILGTPYYMAPEQTLAETPVAETDLWALGVVLYYCLTGRRPFEGNGFGEIKHRIRAGAYFPVNEAAGVAVSAGALGSAGGGVDPELVSLVDTLLSQDPAGRGTAQAVSTRLERYLDATGIADVQAYVRDFLAAVMPSALDRTTVEFQVPKADSGLSGGARRKSTWAGRPRKEGTGSGSRHTGTGYYAGAGEVGPAPEPAAIPEIQAPAKVSWLRQYAVAWMFPLVMVVGSQLYMRWNMAHPVVPQAILEIESSPQGAGIFLDGKDLGITPISKPVDPGAYRLKILHADFPGQAKDTAIFLRSAGVERLVFRFKR
jgi:serine/threonine protein kinase